jgi:hypothetical protein
VDYIELKNNKDIEKLMQKFNWFHDSCIKELQYYSGGYVGEDGSMYPFNSARCVKVIFQSQDTNAGVIELKFDGIKKLNLIPRNEEYDCIIYSASLEKIGNIFYWSEWGDFEIEDLTKEEGTWVSAEKVSWRTLKNAYGNKKIYQ